MTDPQLLAAQQLLAQHLGDALQAIHLYGSAAAGGLRPHSDLDLLVTVSRPLSDATRQGLMRALLDVSAPPGSLLAGEVEPAQLDPDLAILLTKARQHSLCLVGEAAASWFDPVPTADLKQAFADTLAQWNTPEDWTGDEHTVVLALARIWYSLATGSIAAKDVAAQWLLERLPDAHQPVLANARAAYLGTAPDLLAQWPEQVNAFVLHCKSHMPT